MLRLLGILLIIPVVAFATAYGILSKYDSEWNSALDAQIERVRLPADKEDPEYQTVQKSLLALRTFKTLSLSEICSSPETSSFWTGCYDVRSLDFMSRSAVALGLGGIGVVFLIGFCGRVSRRSRVFLLNVFRPGLYITIFVLSGLILGNAALATASIYFGESALVGQIHTGIIAAIGLGAIAGTYGMVKAVFSSVRAATTRVVGKNYDWKSDPDLRLCLETIASQVGTTLPDNVVVGLTPNFFVTEANVLCLDGELKGRTLYISLPLARILSRPEMESVIGHEFGHFHGQDTAYSQRFYPIYRGTLHSLAALSANAGQGARGTALIPAVYVLSYFFKCFSKAETELGRGRELAADATGARITSARNTAIALLKVCAFAPVWAKAQDQMREALSHGKQYVNISGWWASGISSIQDPTVFVGADTRTLSHPTDSHPPLGVRLDALGFAISEIEADSLKTAPDYPAIQLIRDYENLEKELTDVEHYLLRQTEGITEQTSESDLREPHLRKDAEA